MEGPRPTYLAGAGHAAGYGALAGLAYSQILGLSAVAISVADIGADAVDTWFNVGAISALVAVPVGAVLGALVGLATTAYSRRSPDRLPLVAVVLAGALWGAPAMLAAIALGAMDDTHVMDRVLVVCVLPLVPILPAAALHGAWVRRRSAP